MPYTDNIDRGEKEKKTRKETRFEGGEMWKCSHCACALGNVMAAAPLCSQRCFSAAVFLYSDRNENGKGHDDTKKSPVAAVYGSKITKLDPRLTPEPTGEGTEREEDDHHRHGGTRGTLVVRSIIREARTIGALANAQEGQRGAKRGRKTE